MMNEISGFGFGLLIPFLFAISAITNVTVEALKKLLDSVGRKYSANVLAAVTAVIVSVLFFAGYLVLTENTFSLKILITGAVVSYLSFLVATVGYDKVVQMITQIRAAKGP